MEKPAGTKKSKIRRRRRKRKRRGSRAPSCERIGLGQVISSGCRMDGPARGVGVERRNEFQFHKKNKIRLKTGQGRPDGNGEGDKKREESPSVFPWGSGRPERGLAGRWRERVWPAVRGPDDSVRDKPHSKTPGTVRKRRRPAAGPGRARTVDRTGPTFSSRRTCRRWWPWPGSAVGCQHRARRSRRLCGTTDSSACRTALLAPTSTPRSAPTTTAACGRGWSCSADCCCWQRRHCRFRWGSTACLNRNSSARTVLRRKSRTAAPDWPPSAWPLGHRPAADGAARTPNTRRAGTAATPAGWTSVCTARTLIPPPWLRLSVLRCTTTLGDGSQKRRGIIGSRSRRKWSVVIRGLFLFFLFFLLWRAARRPWFHPSSRMFRRRALARQALGRWASASCARSLGRFAGDWPRRRRCTPLPAAHPPVASVLFHTGKFHLFSSAAFAAGEAFQWPSPCSPPPSSAPPPPPPTPPTTPPYPMALPPFLPLLPCSTTVRQHKSKLLFQSPVRKKERRRDGRSRRRRRRSNIKKGKVNTVPSVRLAVHHSLRSTPKTSQQWPALYYWAHLLGFTSGKALSYRVGALLYRVLCLQLSWYRHGDRVTCSLYWSAK